MLETTVDIGYKCAQCGSTFDIGINTNKQCGSCGGQMVPNEKGKIISANVSCKQCNSYFGLINSDKCPTCGIYF
jgi:rRNA maturation endonuclease Nob1